MSSRFAVPLALLLGAPLVAIGCTAANTNAAGQAYYAGDVQGAEQKLLDLLEREPDGRALYLDELAMIALERRELEVAYQRLLEANRIMEAFESTGTQEVGAIVGSEGSKIWRGDPYEKSMNSYFMGIVNFLRGVDDNALAGFKNAIFLDSSSEEQFECDFAPALFLEGIAWERIGDPTMARRSLARAHELAPECQAFVPENGGNVIVVVDVGRGPTKVNAGQHGEATRFLDHPEAPAAIDVLAGGAKIGSTTLAGDVYFQASTRGGRMFDRILKGKAIYKTSAQMAGIGALMVADDLPDKFQGAALIGGIALLLSSLTVNAAADVRHWTTLPARVHVWRGTLPAGDHEIEIAPSSGWRIAGPAKQIVRVPDQGNAFVYVRVLPATRGAVP